MHTLLFEKFKPSIQPCFSTGRTKSNSCACVAKKWFHLQQCKNPAYNILLLCKTKHCVAKVGVKGQESHDADKMMHAKRCILDRAYQRKAVNKYTNSRSIM